MSMIKLFIDSPDMDIKKDIIDKYLGEVDDSLKNNPSLRSQLHSAIRFLTEKSSVSPRVPPMELHISDDGKSFALKSGIRPDPYCMNEALRNNKCYNQVQFSLGNDNSMEVFSSSGTFFKFDDYVRVQEDSELGKMLSRFSSSETPVVCSSYHRKLIFSDKGIEYGDSSYSDVCPLSDASIMQDESEMRAETMIHSPAKWYFNLLPESPRFEFAPHKTNFYRMENRLGVVTYLKSDGKDGQVDEYEFLSSPTHPEKLSIIPLRFKEYKDKGLELCGEYKKRFEGLPDSEIEKQILIDFLKGVDCSEAMMYNKQMYENVRNLVVKSLETRFGYKEETEEKGMTR